MDKIKPKYPMPSGSDKSESNKKTSNDTIEVKYSDSRPVPKKSKNEGYIKGYENVTALERKKLALGLSIDNREIGNNTYIPDKPYTIQKTAEYDTDNFKYGLYDQIDYEDPTILGFELYIDDINDGSPFNGNYEKNTLLNFLTKYKDIPEISKRIDLFKEFRFRFFEIFNSMSNDASSRKYSKNYYIQSITGVNNVMKKIVDYPNDKISITLSEDVSMTAQYLSELYNNLIYSYKSNRYMIPEHLLRFDLHIKVNDMRKFRTGSNFKRNEAISLENIPRTLDNKNSFIVYVLHDCNLDFSNSKNTGDEITVGGLGTGSPSTFSTLSFDIKFKSVSRKIEPILKSGGWALYNKNTYLYGKYKDFVDDIYFKLNKIDGDLNKWNEMELFKYVNMPDYGGSAIDKASAVKKKKGFEKYVDIAKNKVKEIAKETKEIVIRNLKEKRDELINRLISQIKDKTTLRKLKDMGNVYDGSNRESGTEFKKLGSKIFGDVVKNLEGDRKQIITKGKSAMTSYISGFDKKIGF